MEITMVNTINKKLIINSEIHQPRLHIFFEFKKVFQIQYNTILKIKCWHVGKITALQQKSI